MALPPLSITKNWFTSTVVREVNWDNIRTPLLDWAARINLAFGQTTVDAFGSSYTINSTGIPALAVSLQDQINAIIGGTGVLNSLTLINISDGATLTEFTSRWRSPTPAVNDAMIFSQTMNSDTTQDAIGTQFQFIATDVTHATRSSAIALLTMNSGTLAERFRVGPTGALGMISGQKIFLDGVTLAGNTSIRESAANTIMLETDGTDRLALGPTGAVGIISGERFFLDGVSLTGDTYIFEGAANELRMVAGGNTNLQVAATTVGVLSTADFFVTSTKKIFLDGGSNTSIRESAADTISVETGGTDRLVLSNTNAVIHTNTTITSTGEILAGDVNPPTPNHANRNSFAKAWGAQDGSGAAFGDTYNISSISTAGTGIYTFTFDTDFSSTNYQVFVTGISGVGFGGNCKTDSYAVGSIGVSVYNDTGTPLDRPTAILAYGDQ